MPAECKAISPLLRELSQALESDGISYCQWKRTTTLHSSPSRANELDLLVEPSDGPRFREILDRLGFKQVFTPGATRLPGFVVYYAFDIRQKIFVHIDVQYQLLIGHDQSKNYRLAIERPFLDSARQGELFQVPAAEFEFIVFTLRMVLKHWTWDSLLTGEGNLSAAERQEFGLLEAKADAARVGSILEQYLPELQPVLFAECVETLRARASIWAKTRVGLRLQAQLAPCTRRSAAWETFLKQCRRVKWAMRRRILGSSKKRLMTGGPIVAVVGGDGAGKSTAVRGLWEWLAQDFDVAKVHLGKPPWTWTTFAVRALLKMARPIQGVRRGLASGAEDPGPRGLAGVLQNLCTARDRYRAYLKARAFANRGGIVICDRYPLPQIRVMDGPSELQINGTRFGSMKRLLARLEGNWYAKILPPDVLCVLRIDPTLAAQRKVEEDAASVQARCQEIWHSDWQLHPGPTHVLDANHPKHEVLLELKRVVWSAL